MTTSRAVNGVELLQQRGATYWFRDGKIKEVRFFTDQARALRIAGLD